MQSFTRFKLMLKVIIRNSLWPQQTLFVYFLSATVQCLTNSLTFRMRLWLLDKCSQALIVSQHKEATGQQTDWQGRKAVSGILPPDVWTVLSPADGAHWTVLSRLHRDSSVPWTCWSDPRRKSRRPSAGLHRDKTSQSKTWAELQFTECNNHMERVFTFRLVSSVLCSDGWGAIKVLQDHSFTWDGWRKKKMRHQNRFCYKIYKY